MSKNTRADAIGRRRFLKGASAVGAALGASASAAAQSASASAPARSAPLPDMAAESLLSEKDAADIYAFLQSLPGRKPVKDFPILNN